MSYASKYNFDIVIKNNTGTCGNDMFHIKSKKDLFCKIDKLLSKNYSISLSPYYDIHCEYRAIILKDNIELIYARENQWCLVMEKVQYMNCYVDLIKIILKKPLVRKN